MKRSMLAALTLIAMNWISAFAFAESLDNVINEHNQFVSIGEPTYQGIRFLGCTYGEAEEEYYGGCDHYVRIRAEQICQLQGLGRPMVIIAGNNADLGKGGVTVLWALESNGNLQAKEYDNSDELSPSVRSTYIKSLTCTKK